MALAESPAPWGLVSPPGHTDPDPQPQGLLTTGPLLTWGPALFQAWLLLLVCSTELSAPSLHCPHPFHTYG